MNFFNYNGKLYEEGTPVIGVDSRGLRYGDGLFETMRVNDGKLIAEDEHFARLWKGMQLLQFEIPRNLTPEKFQQEILALVNKNDVGTAARIRLSIIRGDGGLYDAKNHFPNYIIQAFPLSAGSGEWNSNGLVLGIYEPVRKSADMLANLKHNNYLPYVLAALHAKKEKWNDAILLNTNGRVCDTTIANIFIVKNDIVYTPALTEGCVAGVVRRMVVNALSGSQSSVIEQPISIDELMNADEVFLTNSIYNIRWVQGIGGKQYKSGVSHKIYTTVLPTIL